MATQANRVYSLGACGDCGWWARGGICIIPEINLPEAILQLHIITDSSEIQWCWTRWDSSSCLAAPSQKPPDCFLLYFIWCSTLVFILVSSCATKHYWLCASVSYQRVHRLMAIWFHTWLPLAVWEGAQRPEWPIAADREEAVRGGLKWSLSVGGW